LIEAIRGKSAACAMPCKPEKIKMTVATSPRRKPSHFDAGDGIKRR
jgi:hypothetical protein